MLHHFGSNRMSNLIILQNIPSGLLPMETYHIFKYLKLKISLLYGHAFEAYLNFFIVFFWGKE